MSQEQFSDILIAAQISQQFRNLLLDHEISTYCIWDHKRWGWKRHNSISYTLGLHRDHFMHPPSQRETTLQCNVSHWLGAYTKWSLVTSLWCCPISVTYMLRTISIGRCKTVVTPMLTHWSHHSLAPSHHYDNLMSVVVLFPQGLTEEERMRLGAQQAAMIQMQQQQVRLLPSFMLEIVMKIC